MKLIGISGKKKSGKDQVCSYLTTILQTKGKSCCRIGFADALKEEVAVLFKVDVQYIEKHKDNFRLILQGYGTDYRRDLFSENYWVDKLIRNVYKYRGANDYVIVPDVRFYNEAQCIKDLGGLLFRVVRTPEEIDSHASEIQLDSYENYDYVIDNFGTLEDLQQDCDYIVKEFKL
jgi:hypothetical protein